jgi:hypothetical protein
MLNIYLIYVSSKETGDVDVHEKVYTSFSKAANDIDKVIEQYVKARGKKEDSRVIDKRDFSIKDLNSDKTFPVGGYCFKKKRSSAIIYKKVVCEGRLWNSTKIEMVGKIGLLSEINIPVDRRLIKIVQLAQEDLAREDNNNDNNVDIDGESDDSDIDSESDSDYNYYDPGRTNNYEHGTHVTFIQELKNRLQHRRNVIAIDDPEPYVERNEEKEMFILSLNDTKKTLNHVTPPPSPQLGRVVDNNNNDDSDNNNNDDNKDDNNIYEYDSEEDQVESDSWDSTSEDDLGEEVHPVEIVINNNEINYNDEDNISLTEELDTSEDTDYDEYKKKKFDFNSHFNEIIDDILERAKTGNKLDIMDLEEYYEVI